MMISGLRRVHVAASRLIVGMGLLCGGLAMSGPASPAGAAPTPGLVSSPVDCATDAVAAVLRLPHVTVDSATPVTSGTFTPPGQPPITGLPVFCDVAMIQTDTTGNPINIEMWLPRNWNGRFEGVGGAGYFCGIVYNDITPTAPGLATGVRAGYATASTDCGHPFPTADFALNPDHTLNRPLITDFASVGMHDMTVDGKALTGAFYRQRARHSYFYGCSMGGRQGLMEAQRYPADYDGIVAGAPAINFTKLAAAELWPALVMKEAGDPLPACKETAFTDAVVAACDGLDRVQDGVIDDPASCRWDPHTLVGTDTPCGTITAADADVIAKIWQGPESTRGKRLWFGLQPGAALSILAGTVTHDDGTTTIVPMQLAKSWLAMFLERDPNWDWTTLTFDQFDALFAQSVTEFSSTIATDDPNLSSFAAHGGKLLVWHGGADPEIFTQGTVTYYNAVNRANGDSPSFARLFLAPGASHCVSAAGPVPDDPLAAVVSWVEHGKAPTALPATLTDPATGGTIRTRTLCAYPTSAHYTGHGDPNDATNFTCVHRPN